MPPLVRRILLASAAGAAVLGAAAVVAASVVVAHVGTRRVVVEGRSMVPTFEPGDRLVVVRLPHRWPVRAGDVVALADPRAPERLLVKRVAAAEARGVIVTGDNQAESTDSRDFGPVERRAVWGRAIYRYAPPARGGRVRRRPPARTAGTGPDE